MKKFNIVFHGSIVLFTVASLIISFVALSEINKVHSHSTTYYGTTNTPENLTTNVNSAVEKPIEIVAETNNTPVSITRAGKYPFILKDRINDTYVIAKCTGISNDVNNSKEYSIEKQNYSVIDYCTSQEEATIFSGNSEMIEYTIEGFKEGRYQLIGVDVG